MKKFNAEGRPHARRGGKLKARRFWPLALLLCGWVEISAAAQTLTYLDILKRLTDLELLAVLPEPGEKGAQWSSFNRLSSYDVQTDRYIQWDAHGDGDGFIRKEGDLAVLAEIEGPGCIWRIWTAKADSGHVYLS